MDLGKHSGMHWHCGSLTWLASRFVMHWHCGLQTLLAWHFVVHWHCGLVILLAQHSAMHCHCGSWNWLAWRFVVHWHCGLATLLAQHFLMHWHCGWWTLTLLAHHSCHTPPCSLARNMQIQFHRSHMNCSKGCPCRLSPTVVHIPLQQEQWTVVGAGGWVMGRMKVGQRAQEVRIAEGALAMMMQEKAEALGMSAGCSKPARMLG